MRRTV
jgi:hypothetical protein